MNTPCIAPCVAIALHRPWWQRALDAWFEPRPARAKPEIRDPSTWHDRDLHALRGLGPQVLRDIGAPEWVHEDRSAAERAALDLWRL